MTKDIILDAAMTILDDYGLGDLTIRRLTKHLGTAAGAMYWHFPSKQALLGAVADRIMEPLESFTTSGDWHTDALAFTNQLHSCLTAHRDGADVVSAALATNTATVRPEQLLADILGGLPGDTSAAEAAEILVFFVLGSTVEEQTAVELAIASGSTPDGADAGVEKRKLGAARVRTGTELILTGIKASS